MQKYNKFLKHKNGCTETGCHRKKKKRIHQGNESGHLFYYIQCLNKVQGYNKFLKQKTVVMKQGCHQRKNRIHRGNESGYYF
jgi:hypothetical protein